MKIRCLNNFRRGLYKMTIHDLTGEIIGAAIDTKLHSNGYYL